MKLISDINGGINISKRYRNPFSNLRDNCENSFNKGFKKFLRWPIFAIISPFKCIILAALLATLLLCGVGLYGLIVIVLLVLLFIFVP
ncbi:hypothetical protein [Clostridium sp. HBUAS56017]|uniref:Uncharacterized protein n=1 Tax=Clostridium cibarium TaxID=2762247 RepID=A0ABR8PNL0_9CLOT|nr:hypothetical protein [Clostridium sp. HBUAS56017]MBD7909767.1 hypothetical protein [Clostridium cibarium]